MIASHHNPVKLSGQLNRFIGIRAVSNNIAEVPDHIVLWCSRKNRFERRQIGEDIRENKCAYQSLHIVLSPRLRFTVVRNSAGEAASSISFA